ncbi:hypothetical protein MT351_05015 [Rathayibacter sp. VKM Ac-2926]|nr:hypothetical protein [Rathayibacter sp. VKM Ac-2926]
MMPPVVRGPRWSHRGHDTAVADVQRGEKIAGTLLIQGSTLPLLIRATGIRGVDVPEDQRELAGLLDEITEKALAVPEKPGEVVEGVDDVDPAADPARRPTRDLSPRSSAS